jgi:hypothetical protein
VTALVICVNANTNTRSKNSSSVETRASGVTMAASPASSVVRIL